MYPTLDLSDTSPPEMGKVRPGLVVSGTAHTDVLNTSARQGRKHWFPFSTIFSTEPSSRS